MIALALAALFACIVLVSVTVAWRRCRQQGRQGLWYLLVPIEVVLITTLALSLVSDLSRINGLGYPALGALALGVELLAWGIAHLLHHRPAYGSRRTDR